MSTSERFDCHYCKDSLLGKKYIMKEDKQYCTKCYENLFSNSCEGCTLAITCNSKDLSYKDRHWHEECFKCAKCSRSLAEKAFAAKDDLLLCTECHAHGYSSKCSSCKKTVMPGTLTFLSCPPPLAACGLQAITTGGVTYQEKPWHRECFQCISCRKPLSGQRFTSKENYPYCLECFSSLYAKKCVSCTKAITSLAGAKYISFEERQWHSECFSCSQCSVTLVGRGFLTQRDDIMCTDCGREKKIQLPQIPAMAFKAFTHTHVYEKQSGSKEKDKSSIQCIERHDRNVYIGTKDATVLHLVLPGGPDGDPSPGQSDIRERRMKKLGSSNQVAQLRVVPLFNHLLVLWDRSLTALNMFSLEPVAALKRIQHVLLFEVCGSSAACVEMVTSSSRRKLIRVHAVGVDRWDVVREVSLPQDPVALALDGACVCVGTGDRYLLCDIRTGSSVDLFPHDHGRQRVIVTSMGRGEFLLNGPESLGVFVMKTGTCQRPPLLWPREVLAAGVCFPYVLTLQPHALSVYSVLDQQCKQTVDLRGAKGLLCTADGALVFTERDVFSLRLLPLRQQTRALVELQRFEEALLLLDGVQGRRPLDSHEELQKDISCLAGFVHFYQEAFSEASALFTTGELDPRELICLYPGIQVCLSEDFQSQLEPRNRSRDLQALRLEDRHSFHLYLAFLGDFLRAVRGTERGLQCSEEVDCALLRLYVELQDTENLQQLVMCTNACRLDHCLPVLEQHSRLT
ncbi:Four and a half LIM domains protein 2 [Liparis tanakae]|uniref:Four and a half LIM domains protein 2 n=1 Tax=Liparis tanakae TaxID=230148 RepID=A0A4Z2F7J0_9TELE|nr:Four and a half LIM domains protein 2 [Liparis tanakae]